MADNAFPLPGYTTVSTISDWESLFAPAFTSGVVTGAGNQLNPTLDTTGRNAVIDTGAAILRAFCKPVSTLTSTPIPAASSQDRIDRLVLRMDRSATVAASFIQPVVITGTPGSNPSLPAITQTTAGLWDLPISHWTSKSTGALTGLVDDRAFTGGSGWQPLTLLNGWGNTSPPNVKAQYRLTPFNSVELIGALNTGTHTSATFAVLPAAYWPKSEQGFASGTSGATSELNTPYVRCDTAGNLVIGSFPSGAQTLTFHGFISLDA